MVVPGRHGRDDVAGPDGDARPDGDDHAHDGTERCAESLHDVLLLG